MPYIRRHLLPDRARLTRAIRFLGAGYLLLGVAHAALLPPWEGFDEFAHYSYIQELADTGAVPAMATARISTDVEAYRREGPMPYSAAPPFEHNGGTTYRSFFAAPASGGAVDPVHGRPAQPRRYEPGPAANWQAQHPPLYYAVLSPIYRATRSLSWGAHLFALRLVSYLFAWAAWWWTLRGLWAAAGSATAGHPALAWGWAALGVAAWPLVFPGWFPEFARLGNDSLAALIAAGVWWIAVSATRNRLSTRHALALGVLLGAGALTKAPFVPVAAGLAGFWLARGWTSGGPRAAIAAVPRVALMLAAAAAIAGWWYLRDRHPYLVPLSAGEVALLGEGGGLAGGLDRRFSAWSWVRGQAALVTTLAWSGTWSLARPPLLWLAPLALVVVLAAAGYAASLRRFRAGDLAWLPAWMALPLAAALSYHAVLRIALRGAAITPGYYFHILFAPLGAALGLALQAWCSRTAGRRLAALLGGYVAAFALTVSWAQVLMFTGHVVKGPDKVYQQASGWPDVLDVPAVLGRLERLAFPAIGAPAFVLGASLVIAAAAAARRAAPEP